MMFSIIITRQQLYHHAWTARLDSFAGAREPPDGQPASGPTLHYPYDSLTPESFAQWHRS